MAALSPSARPPHLATTPCCLLQSVGLTIFNFFVLNIQMPRAVTELLPIS